MIKKTMPYLLAFSVSIPLMAQEKQKYRAGHDQVCHEVADFKIRCGDFKLASTILSKKYDTVSPGTDVMASFSAKTHPGDHPFLNRLAKRLGFISPKELPAGSKLISDWNSLPAKEKGELITRYASVGNAPEVKKALSNYLHICIDYWSDSSAQHDERIQLPTLAEVSALCIADSGVLP